MPDSTIQAPIILFNIVDNWTIFIVYGKTPFNPVIRVQHFLLCTVLKSIKLKIINTCHFYEYVESCTVRKKN